MASISENFFTSTPYQSPDMVSSLRAAYQQNIISNSERIIGYVEKEFSTELSDFRTRLQQIDVEKKLTSKFHNFSVVLESSYANKDIDSVVSTLEAFSDFTDNDVYAGTFKVDSFFSEIFDQKVVDILGDQPGVRAIYGQDPEVLALSDTELVEYTALAMRALETIKELDRQFYSEIEAYINTIRLFKGKIVTGISSILTFGTLYLRIPGPDFDPVMYFIDHFTHETSHHHLHALMGFDPLITNSSENLYIAPIRRDMRPMYGIFHATFVLSRICRLIRRLNAQKNGIYANHLHKVRGQFLSGFETVKSHGELTELGNQVLLSYVETSESDVD